MSESLAFSLFRNKRRTPHPIFGGSSLFFSTFLRFRPHQSFSGWFRDHSGKPQKPPPDKKEHRWWPKAGRRTKKKKKKAVHLDYLSKWFVNREPPPVASTALGSRWGGQSCSCNKFCSESPIIGRLMDCLFPTLDFSRHQSPPPPLVLVRVIIKSLVLVSLSRKNRPLCSGCALGEGEKEIHLCWLIGCLDCQLDDAKCS